MFRALLIATLCFSFTAHASDVLDFTIHQEYTSTRALGMGNAFTTIVDDHSVLFYNPAGLAYKKRGEMQFFLRAGISDNYQDLIDYADLDSTAEIVAELEENYGTHYYSRTPTLGATWVRPKWGIAVIPADLSIDAAIQRQVGPVVNVNAYLDTTIAYGYGWKLRPKWLSKKDRLSIGATAKIIHRINYSDAVGAGDLLSDSEIFDTSAADEGATLDFDVGVLYSPRKFRSGWGYAKYLVPDTYALVIRNLLDYGFAMNMHFLDEDSGEPNQLIRRFDFGMKWSLPNWGPFDPHATMDIRDMGHPNWTFEKGFHFGLELFTEFTSWAKGYFSVGLNQMYWTAGVGGVLGIFRYGLASWGEEAGTSSAKVESRRYVLELALDF